LGAVALGARDADLQHLDARARQAHRREVLVTSLRATRARDEDGRQRQRANPQGPPGHFSHCTLIPRTPAGGGGTFPVSLAASTHASSTKLLPDDFVMWMSASIPSGRMWNVISGGLLIWSTLMPAGKL